MSLDTGFCWLPVTRVSDGAELHLPLHVVTGARPGPTLGLAGMIHGNEPLPTVPIICQALAQVDPVRFLIDRHDQ